MQKGLWASYPILKIVLRISCVFDGHECEYEVSSWSWSMHQKGTRQNSRAEVVEQDLTRLIFLFKPGSNRNWLTNSHLLRVVTLKHEQHGWSCYGHQPIRSPQIIVAPKDNFDCNRHSITLKWIELNLICFIIYESLEVLLKSAHRLPLNN